MVNYEFLMEFIEDNKTLIDENNFDKVYFNLSKQANAHEIATFTELLYQNNVEPLLHMTKIPLWFFLYRSDKEITIPENIKDYSACVFSSDLHRLILKTHDASTVNLDTFAFDHIRNYIEIVCCEDVWRVIENRIVAWQTYRSTVSFKWIRLD